MKSRENLIQFGLLITALSTIVIHLLIALFIFQEGLPIILRVGINEFVCGTHWSPQQGQFGIFPMIVGTAWITAGAILVSLPLSLSCAIYLSEFSTPKVRGTIKPIIELLAGIPSVVYGFMGMVILFPMIRNHLGGAGPSILSASIILGIMILPTITSIAIDSLQAVPYSYREGSLSLGATRWQTIRMAILPAAKSGILSGIILGIGRAVGETMAVIMISGNSVIIPNSLFDPARTLTANIALEMNYAVGDHRQALFATGIVLFITIMILNIIANVLSRRGVEK
ncbi:phosphate ABC transporter permease subunit PstC [bacterium]|nr:phosphate ABC transporter permease subunit PstC [bacterium]MBU1753156.1 phosphate ABC transporter permease subunit PstC [bacterium]